MNWYGHKVKKQSIGSTLAQPALEGSNISASLRPILTEQTDEVGTTRPDSYVSRQAARSLRILIVATEAPPVRSGIARIIGHLRDGFRERGHHVDVLASPEVGRLVVGEVRLSSLIFKLPQLLRRINEYDVIHVHGATPTVSDVALLFARLCSRHSLVIYTHHMDLHFRLGGFLTKIYNHLHHRLSASLADAEIASTPDNLKPLGDNSRGLVIPWSIDLEHFSTNEQKDAGFTILFIGQFRPYKGVRVLLQAMSQVTGVRLLLAGQGPEEQVYRSLMAALGLDVEFHLRVDDDQLRQLYRRAHAVVLPSVSSAETFGLVLVEGMAAGCVPIASNLPGVREVVGPIGFLFPPGRADRLAAILHGLRDDPVLVRQIGDCARVYAAGFGREHFICKYECLITGLIACRDLNDRLADQTQSYESALHAFITAVACDLQADWTQIVLGWDQGELYSVVSTRSSRVLDHRQLQRASALFAQYALNTGESVLLGPNTGPAYLGDLVVPEMPAVIATPLTVDGDPFGALLAMRKRAFDQSELSSLTFFARYVAPSLQKIVKRAAGGADIE